MTVPKSICGPLLWSALLVLVLGCRNSSSTCPDASITAHPVEIPAGLNETTLSVHVTDPFPDRDLDVITKLTAESGKFDDPFARDTIYVCAFDVSGPVEICVNASYADPDADSEAALTNQKLRGPNVYLSDPLECSETRCTTVVCPEVKNACPIVSSIVVEPSSLSRGEAASVKVVAEDPDDNPQPLVTMLSARHGTFANPGALETTYECDPEVGGIIEICVFASDGDSSCDVERCTTVRCPGDAIDENTCPVVEAFTANPNPIPIDESTTTITIDAMDPDDFPSPLMTELSSPTGAFDDPSASETTFACGESGPVEVCVTVSDGDSACDETRCLTVQCPSTVVANLCPMLFVINGVPREIPLGETTTRIETRAQDTDGLPFPLTLTLNALWGSFRNEINIQEPNRVVSQNATYVCDRPGEVEVCVDATDGACTKTLCDVLICPPDVPTAP